MQEVQNKVAILIMTLVYSENKAKEHVDIQLRFR